MRANLKAIIESRFGTQLAFAKDNEVHPVRVNRLINGWVDPTPMELARFAGVLGVEPDWLFADFAIPSSGEVDRTDPVDNVIAAVETFMKQTEPKAPNHKARHADRKSDQT